MKVREIIAWVLVMVLAAGCIFSTLGMISLEKQLDSVAEEEVRLTNIITTAYEAVGDYVMKDDAAVNCDWENIDEDLIELVDRMFWSNEYLSTTRIMTIYDSDGNIMEVVEYDR